MGYSTEPHITHHIPFFPPLGVQRESEGEIDVAGARREAAGREMALMRDLNRVAGPTLRPEMLELKQPILSQDFAQQVEALDQKIYERGISVDREKLVSLGKAGFDKLLEADREARTERVIGARCDLTSFASIFYAFAQSGSLHNVSVLVPARTTNEQFTGAGVERDEVRQISDFADVWKFYGSDPRAVRAIYAFRDIFESLIFGQSLYTWVEDNGRVHHQFFCGGSGNKVHLFEQWLPALKGTHYCITLSDSLRAVVFWLAGEKSEPPDARELARDWFGVRLPSPEQLTLAAALFDGFLLNHKDWNLWQHVGRAIRKPPDRFAINTWREQLRKSFRKIDNFHRDITAFFWKPIGDHREFEPAKHRQFVNRTLDQLLNCASAIVALTIDENSPVDAAPVAARFRDSILCTGSKAKPQLEERICEKLSATFPGATFKIEIES